MSVKVEGYKPEHHIRVVTATSLFDGHDASINITRRLLQDTGVEVIHLGHNRSAQEIVDAAIQEDVQGVAVSSYQGGHVEFFKYIVDLLKESSISHIKIFGGGGGVIVPHEIKELEGYGVTKIYSPEDGAKMGLQGMINHMVKLMDFSTVRKTDFDIAGLAPDNKFEVANLITAVELAKEKQDGHLAALRSHLLTKIGNRKTPTIGITGTGGSGKSSLTDELILRILRDLKDINLAIISSDPSRRKTGGALLGDRIRMNAIANPRVYMRSLATRGSGTEIPHALAETLDVVKAAGFDLVISETAGIGQGDSNMVDVSIYVMTGEFGAATQLEKIDMLDFADLIVINKYEKRGGQDAVREVRKQVQRNRKAWNRSPQEMPVYGTIASKFNDDCVTALYHAVMDELAEKTGIRFTSTLPGPNPRTSTSKTTIIPPERSRYLAEISETVRSYHRRTKEQADALRKAWHLKETATAISADDLQALCAVYDNCNSLHTNAFDEAVTTPSNESVRRALAIQLIINREWGLANNENFNQGSFVAEELTRLVDEAVLSEFDRIAQRGGVLGAMETGYQRSKIQEESMYYESLKHTGKFPIIGVNTFRDPDADMEQMAECIELSRATRAEKESQLNRLAAFKKQHEKQAPQALERLQNVALFGGNIFAELMETVNVCTLGQITQALYDVGGQYRRNM